MPATLEDKPESRAGIRCNLKTWTTPLFLLGVCLLGLGPLTPWLGFYQDDWYLIWFARTFGARVFINFFANERPFLAGIYMLTTPILGTSPLTWQIFALLCRWLAALTVWKLVEFVWPGRLMVATWGALLFLLYPGFLQGYISVVYSHAFLILAVHILSLGLTLLAVRRPARRVGYTILALAGALFSLLSTEYFFGLEFLRPVLLWIVVGETRPSWRMRLRRVWRHWWPYLIVASSFVVWRVFIFRFRTYQPILAEELQTNALPTLGQFFLTVIQDALEVTFLVWERTWQPLKEVGAGLPQTQILALALGGLVGLVSAGYLFLLNRGQATENKPADEQSAWVRQGILVGLFSSLTMGLPFWLVGLQVELHEPLDRISLPFAMGVCLLWTALLDGMLRTSFQKILVVSVAACLATGVHFTQANSFRLVHAAQGDLFHQLAWRVPELKSHTAILMNVFPHPYSGDTSLSAVTNWIYSRENKYPQMDYILFYLPDRLGVDIPALEPDLPMHKGYRSLIFEGSTSQALAGFYPSGGCLHILDAKRDTNLPGLPPSIVEAIPLSDLSRIDTNPAPSTEQTVVELFGSAPETGWCYYYQKAELARQEHKWEEAARFAEQALKLPLKAQNAFELPVYIEAYAHSGNWEKAYQLTWRMLNGQPQAVMYLCRIWESIQNETGDSQERQPILAKIREDLDCLNLK